jgi:hypothetical protein
MYRIAYVTLLLMAGVCFVGCAAQNAPAPAVAQVKGSVTLDGKPMQSGEVRFGVPGQEAKICEIKNGSFAGEVYTGKNQVDVVWEKDGPPNPTDPTSKIKVNIVASNTPQTADVAQGGLSDLKVEAVGAK